ncbi:MAG: DUF481 domain-containing protein [Candidatus Hydrogenedentota bacterium]|nr:MAG: DUF481 domain-containing protein [Candidatus Hydrogenedentota bacterium]
MMRTRCVFLLMGCLMFQLATDVYSDQITMVNGDRISGEILVISDNEIRLVTEYTGEIEVDFSKVESLRTDKGGSIALKNGDIISGKIDSISEGQIIIASELFGVIEVPRSLFDSLNEPRVSEEDVAELERTREALEGAEAELVETKAELDEKEQVIEDLSSPSKLWSGSVSLGLTLERGNTDSGALRFDSRATRTAPRDELQLRLSVDYEESDGKTDTNKVFGQSKLKVFQSHRRYVFGLTDMEYDEQKNLDLRAQAFVGQGYYFVRKERMDLAGEIGGGVVGEFFDENGTSETVEGNLWLSAIWKQKVFEDSEFANVLTLFPNVSQFSEYRLRNETSLTTPMGKHWALKLSLLEEYDSDPEAEETKKNDLTFISSLQYTF